MTIVKSEELKPAKGKKNEKKVKERNETKREKNDRREEKESVQRSTPKRRNHT